MKNQNYKDYLIFNNEKYSLLEKRSLTAALNLTIPRIMWEYEYDSFDDVIICNPITRTDIDAKRMVLNTFEDVVKFINSEDCYIERYVDDNLCAIYKIEPNYKAAWYKHHDGTGDLHGELKILKISMQMRIDDYYISVSDNYMSICIDGQNIIHQRLKPNDTIARARLATVAIDAINGYNWSHDLEWNKIK